MAWFLNSYRDASCDTSWTDEWSCTCNDRCPKCRAEIEPKESVDLSVIISRSDEEDGWIVLVSPDHAESKPDYVEHFFELKSAADYFAGGESERLECTRTE